VSDFLISPPAKTDWRFGEVEFADLLRERWPEAKITPLRREYRAAFDFALTEPDGRKLDGSLAGSGQAVWVRGDVPDGAELAAWVRSKVPSEQELIFCDQGYSFHVPLHEGITAEEIVATVDAWFPAP
jgi:hypothetical protein